jgi:hypothetical protein
LVDKPEGKRPLGRPRCRWEIILDWILEKEVERLWTEFIWPRIGTNGMVLVNRVMKLWVT